MRDETDKISHKRKERSTKDERNEKGWDINDWMMDRILF